MTYEEMKQKVYKLDLESLAHGIKVKELFFGKAFEVAGLGITNLEYFVPISQADYVSNGYCVIYKGTLTNRSKPNLSEPEIVEQLPCNEAYDRYFEMVKEIETKMLKPANKETIYG